MVDIEAIHEFNDACEEIHILLEYSKRNRSNFKRYAAFNKAAIVLLCAKFEAFLESFLEEYTYMHLHASSNLTLDRCIFQHLSDCLLNSIELCKKDVTKRNKYIKELVKLCGNLEIRTLHTYPINTKLKLGKHGQGEVERLLITFGFEVYTQEETVKGFFKSFNSLNSIRNNIIHEDATPSLTDQDVRNYLSIVSNFIKGLHEIASRKLQDMIRAN